MSTFQKIGITVGIIVVGIILASNVTSLFLNYNIANALGTIQTKVHEITGTVQQLGGELQTLKQQFGAIQQTTVGLQNGIDILGRNYSALAGTSERIRTNVGQIGSTLETTKGTLTELGDTIKLFEDFLANTGTN